MSNQSTRSHKGHMATSVTRVCCCKHLNRQEEKTSKNRKAAAAVAVVCMGGDGVERPEGGKRLTRRQQWRRRISACVCMWTTTTPPANKSNPPHLKTPRPEEVIEQLILRCMFQEPQLFQKGLYSLPHSFPAHVFQNSCVRHPFFFLF